MKTTEKCVGLLVLGRSLRNHCRKWQKLVNIMENRIQATPFFRFDRRYKKPNVAGSVALMHASQHCNGHCVVKFWHK